jgi:hypothetical protein
MREAIASAIADVLKAGIGARVVRVDEVSPDPVSAEVVKREVGAINSVLHAVHMVEIDPSLRPILVKLLDSVH